MKSTAHVAIERVTLLHIQQHPSVLEVAIVYEKLACCSRVVELPNAVEISAIVALEKRQGTESDDTYNCLIIDTFGLYLQKAINPETIQAIKEHQIWNSECERSIVLII